MQHQPGTPQPGTPPQQQQQQGGENPYGIEIRDSTTTWILSIVTFGIWGLIWYYKVQEELGQWSRGRIEVNPTNSIMAITIGGCAIVPWFISLNGTGERVAQAQQMAGLPVQASGGMTILYAFLLSYHIKWLTDQLNEIAQRPPQG